MISPSATPDANLRGLDSPRRRCPSQRCATENLTSALASTPTLERYALAAHNNVVVTIGSICLSNTTVRSETQHVAIVAAVMNARTVTMPPPTVSCGAGATMSDGVANVMSSHHPGHHEGRGPATPACRGRPGRAPSAASSALKFNPKAVEFLPLYSK